MSYNRLYYAKKAFSIFPGSEKAVSAPFLAEYYAMRAQRRSLRREQIDKIVDAAFRAWIPFRARQMASRHGLDQQWTDNAIAIARSRFVDPSDIALFRITKASELDDYIRRFEDAGINKIINPKGWQSDCILANKTAFYQKCASHDLPHPEVSAIFDATEFQWLAGLKPKTYIAKPSLGEGGAGVTAIDLTHHSAAELTHTDTIQDFIRKQLPALDGEWLLQDHVVTHASLEPLALKALPTARFTTIINADDRPEHTYAILRFASRKGVIIDNMKAGGILSAADMETGILGIGCKGYGGGDYTYHPETGAPIVGHQLPDWEAAKALCVRAHETAFRDYALIGWDIAFTDHGPVLMEANGKPGVLMPQRAMRKGLGAINYGALLASQIARNMQ